MGDHCNLKCGARLINSVLGDNSTVSCCEMLSNLIFPGHEQHHNNSFLIAACIKGQSNMLRLMPPLNGTAYPLITTMSSIGSI